MILLLQDIQSTEFKFVIFCVGCLPFWFNYSGSHLIFSNRSITKLNISHQTYWLKIVNAVKLLDSLSIIYYSCGSISKASSFRWLLWIAQTEVVQIVFSGVKSYDGPQSMNTNDIRWMRHKLF